MEPTDNEIWVFLSHSHKDYDRVRWVRNQLEEQKFRPLMFFLNCLSDDDEIDNLIKREIDCRTRFILCDSENARRSNWVQREVEYIKSKDRDYEVIDLGWEDDVILKKLNDFKKRATMFISYNRDEYELASQIYDRLSKYDFDIAFDRYFLRSGRDFAQTIMGSIDKACRYGSVISLLTKRVFYLESFVRKELSRALEYDESIGNHSIIPVYMDEAMGDIVNNDMLLQPLREYSAIDISRVEFCDRCDFVVNEVLKRMLAPGSIWTWALKFDKGIEVPVDKEEAAKLYSICFQLASEQESRGNDVGYGVLGFCYEHGYGVEKNLSMAESYYYEHARRFPEYYQEAHRLHNLIEPYSHIRPDSPKTELKWWQRFMRKNRK